MSAWDLLVAHSTAGNGSTAWVHLNSQEGGGGGGGGGGGTYVMAPSAYQVIMAQVPGHVTLAEVEAVASLSQLSSNVVISTVEVQYVI